MNDTPTTSVDDIIPFDDEVPTLTDVVKNYGIEVTAADWNRIDFDGAPLVPIGISGETFRMLYMSERISINGRRDTDYATWNVVTQDGVVEAWPGDFIVVSDNNDLTVIKHKSNL